MTKIKDFPFIRQIALDSFKLRLKVSSLKSYDKDLNRHLITFSPDDDDIYEEFKQKSKAYDLDGVRFRVGYKENDASCKPRPEDCIYILINSKHLGKNYFDGITKKTIQRIYDFIKKNRIIDCDKSAFYGGTVTDMDFKKDYVMEMNRYEDFLRKIDDMTLLSKKRSEGADAFNGKWNKGRAFSYRETRSYMKAPFFKIYHKGLELLNPGEKGSNAFYQQFLEPLDVKNIIRLEATVKNKTHFDTFHFFNKTNTLKDVLDLSFDEKQLILRRAAKAHLEERDTASKATSKRTIGELNATELFFYSTVKNFYELGYQYFTIVEMLTSNQEYYNGKKRITKTLDKVFDIYLREETPPTESEKAEISNSSEFDIFYDLGLVG